MGYTNRIYGVHWAVAFGVPFALLLLCIGLMLSQSGCATGNKGVELNFEPQRKSTVAENIEAGGRVAAGAFDRLFNLEK